MQQLGSRFARWSEDYLHRVSNALVQEALAHDCTHIAFENLEHIRERISNASKFQQWAFRRIQEYTEYKAAEYGIAVEKVAPNTRVNDAATLPVALPTRTTATATTFAVSSATVNTTPTTTRRRISLASYSRTGTGLVLEG